MQADGEMAPLDRLERALEANHLYDEMRADVRDVVAEVKRLRGEVAERKKTIEHAEIGEVWFFQDDEFDNPESLICPVIIQADELRQFLANRAHIARLEGALSRIRDAEAPDAISDKLHWLINYMQKEAEKALAPAQEGGDG